MNNLKSYTEYAVTSSTTDFVIGFDFNYGTDAVNVTVDGVPATEAGYTVMYLNSTTMRLTPAVPTGVVRLQRETDIDVPDNSFTAGAKFIASNMDENFTQIRHAQQEVRDRFIKLSTDTYEIIDTLQDVGQAAQDAADAAEAAAQTANDAAAQVNDKVSYQDLDNAVEAAVTPVKDYIALPYEQGKSYALYERVQLENGDIVKSTTSNNTVDPNVDMNGWVKTNNANQITYESINQQIVNDGVESISDLLAIPSPVDGMRVRVKSYHAPLYAVAKPILGGGDFVYNSTKSAVNDGGYIISGWQRLKEGAEVDLTEFGLVNGGSLDTPLDNAIKFCLAQGFQKIVIPTTGKTDYTFTGGLSYDLNGTPLTIEGQSSGRSGQAINHTGANIGLTFRSFADLWCPVKMRRLSVKGSAAGIAFFRVSDSWNNHFDDSVATGYTNGSIGEIYNEVNWTEGFNSHNVMARGCKNGFKFLRSPLENPASTFPDKHPTGSFYRTRIKNFNFQHGVSSASNAIVIGSYAAENNGFDSCNMYSSDLDIGGWFETGGDSSAINIASGSMLSLSKTEFFYDGAAAMNISSPPTRLFRLGVNAKVSGCTVLRKDTQTAITNIQNYLNVGGVTNIYPFRSVAHKSNEFESENGVDTFDATVSPIKFQFSLSAGESATIRLMRLFKASEYRIKLTKNDAGSDVYRYHSQGLTNVGYLVCETLHPKITTTMSGSAAPYIATSVASLPDGTQSGAVVRLLNNLAQGAFSTDYFLGCEVYVPAVSANSTFTVTIEKI